MKPPRRVQDVRSVGDISAYSDRMVARNNGRQWPCEEADSGPLSDGTTVRRGPILRSRDQPPNKSTIFWVTIHRPTNTPGSSSSAR
jgi:hypothetical protein